MTSNRAQMHFGVCPVLLLTAVSLTTAQPQGWAPWDDEPSVFVRAELLSIGASIVPNYTWPPLPNGSLLSVEVEWNRFRLGASAVRVPFVPTLSPLPVSLGYTLWERPQNYAGRLFGKVPEVWTRFTADWTVGVIDEDYDMRIGTLEVGASADYVGLGITASAGVMGWYLHDTRNNPPGSFAFMPFVGVRASLLTFTAGF